ncbi:MAG: peptidase C11, partial [Ruminococcaceae bacterium]|nr:peptidase C11 [Oscillospiraceae bacterium]
MDENRPRGREKHITGEGKDVHKRGEGLGTGPVGSADGHAGRAEANGGGGGQRASGGRSPLMTIIVLAVLLLGGGGAGLSGLLGGSSEQQTTTAPSSYTQQTAPSSSAGGSSSSSGGMSGALTSLLGSYGGVSDGWAAGSNTGRLNESVANGARAKRTKIQGSGRDTVTIMVYMCG